MAGGLLGSGAKRLPATPFVFLLCFWHNGKTTTTLYQGGAVYQNDSLQFISHEEGRIRPNFNYSLLSVDYFLKDHLGNIRMVITDENRTDTYPAATFESGTLAAEKLYYKKLDAGRQAKPKGYPYYSKNKYVQKLNGKSQPR